jgi:polar amino acid transport system ATP-binding protein
LQSPATESGQFPLPDGPDGSAGPEPNEVVNVRGCSKAFGETVVLDELDLTVQAGEHVALIGPSGSGKTTVLRVLMGLERPDRGRVEIAGQSLWHSKRRGELVPASDKHIRTVSRHVGMVFQQFNLFPHMTALENVALAPTKVLGLSNEDAKARAKELLITVGLEKCLEQPPAQLSGGQQQRVAIARALALQPKVMLFDEVTSALDPELVNEVLSVIRGLALHTDMAILIVTHEMTFAADIADRILMFDSGKIIEEAPPAQLLSAPVHERTQRFLKSIIDRRGT